MFLLFLVAAVCSDVLLQGTTERGREVRGVYYKMFLLFLVAAVCSDVLLQGTTEASGPFFTWDGYTYSVGLWV